MRRITRILIIIFIAFVLTIVYMHCYSVMGKVPSIRTPPASFEVVSLAFTLSDGEITEIKARVRNNGGFGGCHNLTLLVDSNKIATKTITVAPDSIETLCFDCSISKNEGHIVELDRFVIPIEQLTAVTLTDPEVFTIGGDIISSDIKQAQQIINLSPPDINETMHDASTITHKYTWLFDGVKWVWELNIPESLYSQYKELKRPSTNDFSVYVTHPVDDLYMNSLTSELGRAARQNGYDAPETIQFVAAFVQGLPYTIDTETTGHKDYPRYPVETLADFGGDCEDTAILLAALLDSMGYEVVIIAYPNHYGIGVLGDKNTYGIYWVHDGGEYFYLETSIGGWKIGEIPEHLANVPAVIYTLD
jgi:predicted transglutaminase-like cysteine proteinase